MDVSQYLEIFLDETKEHLQSLNTEILNLEQDPENSDTINEIFRAAHSLKGMAGTMGYKRMQALTHDMENVFSEVRNGTIKVKGNMIDILFKCLDALEEYLNAIQASGDEGTNDNAPLIKLLNEVLESKGSGSEAAPKAEKHQDVSGDSVPKQVVVHEITFDETQKRVLNEALRQGKNVYGITVKVQETCILKAARAFLVFKSLEALGEIIVSDPPVQDIEDERFDLEFSLVFISDSPLSRVVDAVKHVSEIEDVQGSVVDRQKLVYVSDGDNMDVELPMASDKNGSMEAVSAERQAVLQTAGGTKTAEKKTQASKPVVNRTVRVDIEKLDVLMNLVSELIIAKNSLVSASGGERGNSSGFNEQIEYLESVTTNLHESVMKVRMVPIESVVNKFPRMIRDLSKKLDKKMELYMSGEETELDRTVVDEIGDPLMHLLRNAADHGLETAQIRKESGKPAIGSIFLDAYQDGNNVVIEVRDDGAGINTEMVKNKAVSRGIITVDQGENMSEQEIMNLLFHAGFSTADVVSDVSGRGVGLDVVKSKIEALSGEVEVKSKPGIGSTWTIRLPLTLAIIQALMVDVGGEKYAVSLGSIQTIEDISPSEIKTVQNKEVIHLRGIVIPLIRLSGVLDVTSKKSPEDNMTVVIVKKGSRMAGLVVDELMGQQEIVIKSLGRYITKCKVISGATILGDGEVALILDTNALF
ncbi:two-component system chemotaxis sensor kinase CheA [Kineothrix alysoides]|uniref:Chemotaxis protein CheA n=1 Tax=Kineothrix alysoides TaxID=1469948 RepID=A0A4R1QY03_9FIRM|nr:chemotaxis protein CheA [Kineothrix alysoides]TCL56570.1 two-component system chemotaxis sensor kinase CheA [Kineothrix alysoides]